MHSTKRHSLFTHASATGLLAAAILLTGCGGSGTSTSTGTDSSSNAAAPNGASAMPVAFEQREVEASCGLCMLGMESTTCELAIRVDGETHWVDGVGIDDLGDAHAEDGFCNMIRRARVTGTLADGRFNATEIELLPVETAGEESADGDGQGG